MQDPTINTSELEIPDNFPKGKETGYRIDPNYFDDFQERLDRSVADLEEIRTIAPILYSIPKHHPFGVPKDYFDELATRVSSHTVKGESWFSSIKLWFKPRFALPVLTTLLIAITAIRHIDSLGIPCTAVENQEITTEEQLYSIDEDLMIDQLSADNTTVTEQNSDVENYILENTLDETNLENEL